MSAIITLQGVEKSFGTRRILDGVSFAIHEGDRIGLIGVNGSGKSTLLRLIAATGAAAHGDDLPDAGLITRRKDLSLGYVSQEPQLDPDETIRETLQGGLHHHKEALSRLAAIDASLGTAEGADLDAALLLQAEQHERIAALGGWDKDHEIRGLAAALCLQPLDTLVATLSIGERRRVALGRALLSRPDLLALDEPTNHLDARTVEWLEARLAAYPGTLLLVTHDRYFLDRVATRILELDRGRLWAYEGGYSRFLEKQAERLDQEAAAERERASFVRRELDWIRRGPQARGTKQKARIDRFNQAVQSRPAPGDRQPGDRQMVLRLPTGGRMGKTILEVRGLSKSLGGKRLFSDLTLILKPGDRIGVVGENGAGKTTLVRTLLGLIPPDAGEVIVGHNTRFAFLDQGRADLDDTRTVLQEVSGDNENVYLDDGPVHVRTFLRMMLFDDAFADTPVGALSGGERNRVQLAKLLRQGGNLLVLDEPTNDLDLITLGVIEEALQAFPGCAIVVSHDRWFLDRVATGILAFEGQGRVTFYEGDYTSYLSRRQAQAEAREMTAADKEQGAGPDAQARKAAPQRPLQKETARAATGPRRITFREGRELAGMEEAILLAEGRVSELQAALSDPSVYKERSAEVPALVAGLDAARAEVEALYARWQELEALAR